MRRKRETKASAILIWQELVSAYSSASGVRHGLADHPEELYLRRDAWQAHGGAVVRSLALDDANRVARAYSALDDLDRILRAGAPPESFSEEPMKSYLQTNVIDDLLRGVRVVGALTGLKKSVQDERIEQAEHQPPPG